MRPLSDFTTPEALAAELQHTRELWFYIKNQDADELITYSLSTLQERERALIRLEERGLQLKHMIESHTTERTTA